MTTAAMRELLHSYVDTTDDRCIMDLFLYIEHSMAGKHKCYSDDMAELHQRVERVFNETATTFTVDDAHEYIRTTTRRNQR